MVTEGTQLLPAPPPLPLLLMPPSLRGIAPGKWLIAPLAGVPDRDMIVLVPKQNTA
jgi:hypothetical protein